MVETKPFVIPKGAYMRHVYLRALKLRAWVIGLLSLGAGALMMYLGNPTMGLVMVLVVPPLAAILGWLTYTQRMARRENRAVFEMRRTMRFDDKGAQLTTETGIDSTVPWSQFPFAETNRLLTLLFMNSDAHWVVLHSAFESDQDLRAFQDLVAANLTLKRGWR